MKTVLLLCFSIFSFLFTSIIFSQTISWEQLNGPFGGTALCFATNSNGDLFAGADENQRGVYKSTDNGITWLQKSNGIAITDRAVSWITVDDSNYVIIGTNSHIGASVYKSTNDGESWVKIADLGGTSVTQNANGDIYVGNTGYAQYSVSTDAGYTWTHFSHPSPFINCIEINDSGHIFIGGNYTGYRSTDYGTSWTNLSLPDGINSFAFAPNGDVYAGCSRDYASNSGVYKSTDNGDSWMPVKEGFRVYPTDNIVINNTGDIFVGSYGWGIWRSTDDGVTWTQQNSGLGHYYIKSMYVTDNAYIYAGASGGGIYRSTDNGESWQQVGLTAVAVKRIAINPLNGFIFTSVSGMARSTDSGFSWEPTNNGLSDLDVRAITIKNDGTIFCGVGSWATGVVYRSTNNGNNWERSDNGLPHHDVSGLTFDAEGNICVSIDYNGVHKSTDNGITWSNIGDPPGGKLAFNSLGDLFLASWGGGVWKLPHGDTVWVNITGSIYPYVDCIFIGSNNYIYAAENRSTDNGATWTPLNIPANNVYSYAENSEGHLFCGTYNYGGGVFRSTDYGETWEAINSGLPTQDVRCVAVDADDYLYAGPWGYSLFKTITPTVTSVENERQIPLSFSLEQNYPNPFNPSTKIKYTIPQNPPSSPFTKGGSGDSRGGFVILKVYDVLGNEIAILVNEEKAPGTYEVEFQSTLGSHQLASQIYFYQLRAGDPSAGSGQVYVQTKKMILLK